MREFLIRAIGVILCAAICAGIGFAAYKITVSLSDESESSLQALAAACAESYEKAVMGTTSDTEDGQKTGFEITPNGASIGD